MADSVDRVFVHALNTVKRIPRLGSSRPPPSDRLKLYGLYKQSMEGDVDTVMDRPQGDSDEVRSDQEKWDAWNLQKGLSRTEAKRQYISTLIDTMHKYASQTQDARELVAELEFVWDQIKSNPPSTSSSNSYPHHRNSGDSPVSTNDRPIYPEMSERGSRNPRGRGPDPTGMRVLSPVSQNRAEDGDDAADDVDREAFVDAPDSQMAENDIRSPAQSPSDDGRDAKEMSAIVPASQYAVPQAREGSKPKLDSTTKWHRRIEGAIIKMNAEVAALREQLDMQQSQSVHGSVLGAFAPRRRSSFSPISGPGDGLLRWILDMLWKISAIVLRHILIDATVVALVTGVLYYRGIPAERLEAFILRGVRRIQQLWILKWLERVGRDGRGFGLPISFPRSLAFLPPRRRRGG